MWVETRILIPTNSDRSEVSDILIVYYIRFLLANLEISKKQFLLIFSVDSFFLTFTDLCNIWGCLVLVLGLVLYIIVSCIFLVLSLFFYMLFLQLFHNFYLNVSDLLIRSFSVNK